MDIFEFIKSGKLSSFGMQYEICLECGAVAFDLYPPVKGVECRFCGQPIKSHRFFFQDLLLLDLIQEAYNAIPEKGDQSQPYPFDAEHTHAAGVIILFCTLKELLLLRFIYALMDAKNIPDPIQERLIADNNTHEKRLKKLFPSLVGARWDETLGNLNPEVPEQSSDLNAFLKSITDVRNEFVHKGILAKQDRPNAEACLRFLWPLLDLFVSLNNTFVHPIRLDSVRKRGGSADA